MNHAENWLLFLGLFAPLFGIGALFLGPAKSSLRTTSSISATIALASSLITTFGRKQPALNGILPGLQYDGISASLMPGVAAITLSVLLSMPKRELVRKYAIAILSTYAAIALLMMSHHVVWLEIAWILSCAPILFVSNPRPRRVAFLYFATSTILVVLGCSVLSRGAPSLNLEHLALDATAHPMGFGLLILGISIRLGVVPFHSWMLTLFQEGPLAPAMVMIMPMPSLVVVERLVTPTVATRLTEVPGAPAAWIVASALLAAGMTLVQSRLRRALGWFAIAVQSAVLLGVLDPNPIGHTGGIAMWMTLALSLTGFGITVHALVSRCGDLRIDSYSGFNRDMPMISVLFLVFGLACAGLPGTVDFVSEDLTLHGSIAHHPLELIGFISAESVMAFSVLWLSSRIFFGKYTTRHRISPILRREHSVLVGLAVAILLAGLFPQGLANWWKSAKTLDTQSPMALSKTHNKAGTPIKSN
jgi:NADH-quinone oxidoreductase subunit M